MFEAITNSQYLVDLGFDGLMMEIGAFRPNQKGGLEWTTPGGSWNEYADVLYCAF